MRLLTVPVVQESTTEETILTLALLILALPPVIAMVSTILPAVMSGIQQVRTRVAAMERTPHLTPLM